MLTCTQPCHTFTSQGASARKSDVRAVLTQVIKALGQATLKQAPLTKEHRGPELLGKPLREQRKFSNTPASVLRTIATEFERIEPQRAIAYMHVMAAVDAPTPVPLLAQMMQAVAAQAATCNPTDWCALTWALTAIASKWRDRGARWGDRKGRCVPSYSLHQRLLCHQAR